MAGVYHRKAYTYVNKRGKRVSVPATTVSRRARPSRSGAASWRAAPPAARTRKRTRKYSVDSPLRAVLPSPRRVVGRVSVKQGAQRLTQKNATRNAVKRQGRKQVRKVLPGTALIKVKRVRARRRR